MIIYAIWQDKSSAGDPLVGRELEVARELIGEVFSVGRRRGEEDDQGEDGQEGHDQGSRSQKGSRGEYQEEPKKEPKTATSKTP